MIPENGQQHEFKQAVLENVVVEHCPKGHPFVAQNGWYQCYPYQCPVCGVWSYLPHPSVAHLKLYYDDP
jgi:hypothetical protein